MFEETKKQVMELIQSITPFKELYAYFFKPKDLYSALSKFRNQVKAIKKDSENKAFEDWKTGKIPKYASLDAIWETIQEPLTKNGLSIIQEGETVGDTFIMQVPVKGGATKDVLGCWVKVYTTIIHESGESITLKAVRLPCEANVHKIGGAITYGKRYGLAAALGLSTDDDDDGNSIAIDNNIKLKDKYTKAPQQTPQAQYEQPAQAKRYEYKEPKVINAKGGKYYYTDDEIDKCIEYVKSNIGVKPKSVWGKVMAYDHPDVSKVFKEELKAHNMYIDDEKGEIMKNE